MAGRVERPRADRQRISQLVEFLCLALLKPGDVVFTENPTHDRTITMLRRHGMQVVGIPPRCRWSEPHGARSGARHPGAEGVLSDSRLPESVRHHVLR